MDSGTVNLFFACDDGYIPFLAVTLTSIKKHKEPNRNYAVRILNTGILPQHKKRIKNALECEGFRIDFHDISREVEKISQKLHTRDYYSKTTYFRLFIPELYPELDKALYLDCDLVLCDDVAKLYDVELSDNLVGAISDAFVLSVPRLHGYVTERIGVHTPKDYFNAGVLLMNLNRLREENFGDRFIELLEKVTFVVAQDQDYLNVLCNGKRCVVAPEWNCMPGFCEKGIEAKLIHYNLDSKPWHKDGIEFSDEFWSVADNSCYASEIREIKKNYADEEKSEGETRNLIDVAEEEGRDEKENQRIKEMLASILK